MLTLPQIAPDTSRPSAPDWFPFDARMAVNYCLYCGALLQHAPMDAVPSLHLTDCDTCGLYHVQYVCPIKSGAYRAHERVCMECAAIMAACWHYQGRSYTLAPTVHMEGVYLDVYVWLLTHQRRAFTPAPETKLARELAYSRSTIHRAFVTLMQTGLLAKERHGRANWYRPLIQQKPKGW